MASTTWRIQGVDTQGADLVLSRIQPWGAGVAAVPISITSTFAPVSGSVEDLLVDDDAECVFAATAVYKPGFAIEFTFATPVDLWGFRFAGPSDKTWPMQHGISYGTKAASVTRVQWLSGALSPKPTMPPQFDTDGGTWVAQAAAGTHTWNACAVSAGGNVLLGGAADGNLWLSKDGGATWAAQTAPGVRPWYRCAASADGRVLFICATGVGNLWLSKDGGDTWVAQTSAGSRSWSSCAVSADGSVLLAGVVGGNLWLSKDGGATWVAQTAAGSGDWFGGAVSADGTVLLSGASGGNLWLSKDGGGTWVAQTAAGSRAWFGCSASADGSVLLSCATGGNLWLSKDRGGTWVAQTSAGTKSWNTGSVSADGRVLISSVYGGNIWRSQDGGDTWVAQTGPGIRDWTGCSLSGDGTVILGSAYAGNMWLSVSADPIYRPVPRLVFAAAANAVVKGLEPLPQELGPITRTKTHLVRDMEFGGNGRVYGTVERKNTPSNVPMRRRVRLHRSKDGLLVRETWSKADGTYEFKGVSMQYEYDAIAWDNEMSYRSVIANNLKPEAM